MTGSPLLQLSGLTLGFAGNTVLDGAGNEITEKGFYLFKNSWGTSGFGIDHPAGDVAGIGEGGGGDVRRSLGGDK